MGDVYTDYGMLLNRFLEGGISAEEFQCAYLERFKNEERKLGGSLYELLEDLFGDVDSFSTNQELLAENPGFYLDEAALREKTAQALKRLIQLQQGCGGT